MYCLSSHGTIILHLVLFIMQHYCQRQVQWQYKLYTCLCFLTVLAFG